MPKEGTAQTDVEESTEGWAPGWAPFGRSTPLPVFMA